MEAAREADSTPVLSPAEVASERLYYAAISRKHTFREAVSLAKHLERESPIAGAYLRWLIAYHGDRWPTVGRGDDQVLRGASR